MPVASHALGHWETNSLLGYALRGATPASLDTGSTKAVCRGFRWDESLANEETQHASTTAAPLFPRVWPYVPQLRGYLQQRLSAAEVDDVIQDVFLRLFQRSESREVEFPKRYLFQVAQAAMIDRHRREASRCTRMHCELSDADHPTDELSPLRILMAREEIQAVETAIKDLPQRTREIIIAIRLEGWSLKSLATRYKISTSAIEKHITRAIRALAATLADSQLAGSASRGAAQGCCRPDTPPASVCLADVA